MDVLSTGYFLVSREAVRLFKGQALGGSLIFVGSKNAWPPRPRPAYGAAKARNCIWPACSPSRCAPLGRARQRGQSGQRVQGFAHLQGSGATTRAQQPQG